MKKEIHIDLHKENTKVQERKKKKKKHWSIIT